MRVRVIQGPKTKLSYTDNVTVDPAHGEVITAQFRTDAILVFGWKPGGGGEPARIIHGPKTKYNAFWMEVGKQIGNGVGALKKLRLKWGSIFGEPTDFYSSETNRLAAISPAQVRAGLGLKKGKAPQSFDIRGA